MEFIWDKTKARINKQKHRISFEEAQTIFGGPFVSTADAAHSDTEDRLIAIGTSQRARVLTVVYSQSEDAVRIISARNATRQEALEYLAHFPPDDDQP